MMIIVVDVAVAWGDAAGVVAVVVAPLGHAARRSNSMATVAMIMVRERFHRMYLAFMVWRSHHEPPASIIPERRQPTREGFPAYRLVY
jgi:hypothetical protein